MAFSYDLHLPAWGPYNKHYLGAAHIADPDLGLRMDVNLFPGYYRRSAIRPLDVADSGVKMMSASADLSHFVYRYELEWKDRVFLDADFCSNGPEMTICCRFCNETDRPESLSMNAVFSLHSASAFHEELVDEKAVLPEGCCFVNAVDYDSISCAGPIPSDGLRRGEERAEHCVGGNRISSRFFCASGHQLTYRLSAPVCAKSLAIRYHGEGRLLFSAWIKVQDKIAENTIHKELVLPKKTENGLALFDLTEETISAFTVSYLSGTVDLDGFVFGPLLEEEQIRFEPAFSEFDAQIAPFSQEGPLSQAEQVRVEFGPYAYDVHCDGEDPWIRILHAEDAGILLESTVSDHVSWILGKSGQGRVSADLFFRPVFVDPHSTKEITLKISAVVPKSADRLLCDPKPELVHPICNSDGDKYIFSQQLMQAVTLTNVVYPIYCGRSYIRHNTPGRVWDSLYTWDSGFIGMGLATMDPDRAIDCLNTYLPETATEQEPYTQHGTPFPTQLFLLQAIFSHTGSLDFLRTFYPRAKRQYDFFSAQKMTEKAKNVGIFHMWDVFYNSGGWDDYPPQVKVHREKAEDRVSPVINTAGTALFARILLPLARLLGEETAGLQADIAYFEKQLNTWAWDEESGYYGYIEKREDGTIGILKENGVNADMGLDGVYPMIAGVAPKERCEKLLDHIRKDLMTDIGISVVDIHAPYYRLDGYWNGSVWMPHQWILWKALLDYGEVELTTAIAEKALALWEKETSYTYNCWEHFMVRNGRGAGFHQFSGLSTPVLMWFEAYYRPGTVTGGFGTLVTPIENGPDALSFHVTNDREGCALIVCLPEKKTASVVFPEAVHPQHLHGGTYALYLFEKMDTDLTIRF